MRLKYLICFFLIVFFSFAVFAILGEGTEIRNTYINEDYLEGKVNMSLDNESIDADLRGVFSGIYEYKVGLVDFLEENNLSYSCSPANCEDDYQVSGGETDKSFELNGEKFIGILLNGRNIEIKDFEFDVSSSAVSSCTSQLQIDILNDKEVNWVNDKFLLENCGSEIKSTCSNSFPVSVLIDQTPYCEQINLSFGPAFEVSMGIEKSGGSFYSGILNAYIYDKNGNNVGECELSNPASGRSKCVIEYANKKEQEHFVCVSLKEGEASEAYRLNANLLESCGFHGDPAVFPELVASYDIKVLQQKYSGVGSFSFDEEVFSEQNNRDLEDYFNAYLQERYSGDCSQGCVIPIRFSGGSQTVSVSDLDLDYDVQGGSGLSENNFYNAGRTAARINSDFFVFDLSNVNYSLPKINGNYTFELFLNYKKIFGEEISVFYSSLSGSVVRQIYPSSVAVANPTLFTIFIDPFLDTSGMTFRWDFGDGFSQTTSKNKIVYTYSEIGNYTLKVTLLNGIEEIGSANFDIKAESPKEAINLTLTDYEESVEKIQSRIEGLNERYREVFDEELALQEIKSDLENFRAEYNDLISDSGTLDSDYVYLMEQIVNFEIPLSVQPSQITNVEFINDLDNINLYEIENLFDDSNYGDENAYANAIVKWFVDNIDGKLNQEVWTVYYPTYSEDILTKFNVRISPRESLDYLGYFVVNESSDVLIFDSEYNFSEENNGVSGLTIDFLGESVIGFAKRGNVAVFDEVVFYLTPELDVLDVEEGSFTRPNDLKGWLLLLGALALLFLLALAFYVFLQEWYKKNYEGYLFKNRADLYNLIYFIRNAKRQRIEEKEIKKKLRKSKWKGEQVNYALKKLSGKRIGMWEIPILRFREKKKIEQEMRRRKRII